MKTQTHRARDENSLESLLRLATEGQVPEQVVVAELETAPLYALGFFSDQHYPAKTVVELSDHFGKSVQFIHRKRPNEELATIFCFSSVAFLELAWENLARDFWRKDIAHPYIKTVAPQLFSTTRGAILVLNPGLGEYERTFPPEAVDRLLGLADPAPGNEEHGVFFQQEELAPAEDDENPLETALRQATLYPAKAPAFYPTFLSATLYGLIDQPIEPGEEEPLNETTVLIGSVNDDGTLVFPVFSSMTVLQHSLEYMVRHQLLPMDARISYVELSGQRLLEQLRGQGHGVHLNPIVGYSRRFYPHEIEHLLDHGLPLPTAQTRVTDQDVRFSPLESPPPTLADALIQWFSGQPTVKEAHLVWLHHTDRDDPPRYLVSLDVEDDGNDSTPLILATLDVANTVLPEADKPIFVLARGPETSALNALVDTQSKPFYERRWGQQLHSTLKSGQA